MEQAVALFVAAQSMNDEIDEYERDEDKKRPKMPGVFSVDGLKSANAAKAIVVDCKSLFEKLLTTIKNWTDKTRE